MGRPARLASTAKGGGRAATAAAVLATLLFRAVCAADLGSVFTVAQTGHSQEVLSPDVPLNGACQADIAVHCRHLVGAEVIDACYGRGLPR
jgi:hypothetical protein